MAVLDTSFLIDILRGKANAVSFLHDLEKREDNLFITSLSVMELWSGAFQAQMKDKEIKKIGEFLMARTILSFDERAAKRAGEIDAVLTQKGTLINPEDMMIAGIALSRGESVVAADKDYAKILGLRVLLY